MSQTIQVLYVEDDEDIRTVADMALDDEGFELIVCESGQQALSKVDGLSPDLFLLDVMMPGMDGPTTLHELRKYPKLAETPAIFMTAKVQPDEIEQYKALACRQ